MAGTDGSIRIDTEIDQSGINTGIKEIGDKLGDVGDKIKGAGESMSKYFTVPITGLGVAAFKFSNDLNSAMANVSTLIPNNIKRIQELKQNVQEMAEATGKSTGDIADGLYQVISTFGDTADTSKILEMNVKAAAAGMATTTDAINLTAAVSKGYNDTSSTMIKHITDLAFQTANLGITTFPELSSSIGSITPLAATLGVKMNDMFAVFATGAGVTGSTSQVATQFQNVLQALMAPTKDMSSLMKKLGYSNGEAMLKSLGLQGTIDKIVGTAKKANVPLQNYISSIDGQTLALALNGNLSKNFTSNLKAMGNVAGSTDNAFKQQTEGVNKLGFQWEQAKQRGVVFLQNVGDALAPVFVEMFNAMKPVVAKIGDLIQKFSEFDPHAKMIIAAFAGILAIIGPTLVVMGTLISSVGAVIEFFAPLGPILLGTAESAGFLSTAFTVLTGPVGLIIAAVIGLIAIFKLLWDNSEQFRNAIIAIWDDIKAGFSIALNAIMNVVRSVMTSVMDFFGDVLGKIKGFWNENGQGIVKIIVTVLTGVWIQIKFYMGIILGVFQMIWPMISAVIQVVWAVIKVTIMNTLDIILGALQFFTKLFTGDWSGAFNTILQVAKNIWGNIKKVFTDLDLYKIGKNILEGLINGFNSMVGTVKKTVASMANMIPDGLKKILGIHSPSRVLSDEVGKWIPKGLSVGIDKNLNVVSNSVGKMADTAIPVMPHNVGISQITTTSDDGSSSMSLSLDGSPMTLNIAGYQATGLINHVTRSQQVLGNRQLRNVRGKV